MDGKQYCLFGDSLYAERVYLEVPFTGSSLLESQRAYNKAISKVLVALEWYFMELKR